MLNSEFKIRTDDINCYFDVIGFIDGIEVYKKGGHVSNSLSGENLKVTSEMQKCLRAGSIILLYNLVESTFRNCIYLVYDTIHDEGLKYGDLSDEMKRIWIEFQFMSEMKVDKVRTKAKEISDKLSDHKVMFDGIPKGTSGNLNLQKIIEISKKVGVNLGRIPDRNNVSNTLELLKTQRNHLAHGNHTFSSIGSLVTLNDLLVHKDSTIKFLRHLVKCYSEYIDKKMYKSK